MRNPRSLLLIAGLMLSLAVNSLADVPSSMTVQGRLTDAAGVPIVSDKRIEARRCAMAGFAFYCVRRVLHTSVRQLQEHIMRTIYVSLRPCLVVLFLSRDVT